MKLAACILILVLYITVSITTNIIWHSQQFKNILETDNKKSVSKTRYNTEI
jgi:hypothetical protein